MSWQAWLGWLAWGVVVFFILLWHQGRREARERELAGEPPRRRHGRRRQADPPRPECRLPGPRPAPGVEPPPASFEGWVDAYQPRGSEQPPAPPWRDEDEPAPPAQGDAAHVARTRVAIVRAIACGAAIRFEYTDREGGRSTRTVHPRALEHVTREDGAAPVECVVGWCQQRNASRSFRLARIRNLELVRRA